jgi:hypothetical protein
VEIVNRNEDHWHVCQAALFLKLHVTFRFGTWNKVERLGVLYHSLTVQFAVEFDQLV